MRGIYKIIKRIIDFIFSLTGIIILSPIYLITAIAIKLDSEGPIIFVQKRNGLNGKLFNCYKFRSMVADNNPLNLSTENKITRVGKFIRKTSIDELPQLFNVLKGDMSFIGPRPWPPTYTDLFTEEQRHRNDVLPGITGLAQVHGRNDISVLERIDYDLIYVKNFSFLMDLKVLGKTIATIFSEEGAEITKKGIKHDLEVLEQHRKEVEGKKKTTKKTTTKKTTTKTKTTKKTTKKTAK